MKKLLIGTSALLFSGQAFAAVDVSGYAGTMYESHDSGDSKTSRLFTESEVYIGASKTTENGLTFGVDTTLGITNDTVDEDEYFVVNTYLSGSVGQIKMGTDIKTALRSKVVPVYTRNAFGYLNGDTEASVLGMNLRGKHGSTGAFAYNSPEFYGVSAALTTDFSDQDGESSGASSFALAYNGEFSGVKVGAAVGQMSFGLYDETAQEKTAQSFDITDYISAPSATMIALGVEVAGFKGNIALANASVDKNDMVSVADASDPDKENLAIGSNTRIALGYEANGFSVTVANLAKTALDADDYNHDTLEGDELQEALDSLETSSTAISFAYELAEGLVVGASYTSTSYELDNVDDAKSMAIGTEISF